MDCQADFSWNIVLDESMFVVDTAMYVTSDPHL